MHLPQHLRSFFYKSYCACLLENQINNPFSSWRKDPPHPNECVLANNKKEKKKLHFASNSFKFIAFKGFCILLLWFCCSHLQYYTSLEENVYLFYFPSESRKKEGWMTGRSKWLCILKAMLCNLQKNECAQVFLFSFVYVSQT